jgi:hypothetical protein
MKKRILALLLAAVMIVAIAPMSLAAPADPPELAAAFKIGGDGSALAPWPFAAGTYDPALDGQGIPNGAYIYGLFDAAYAVIPDPSSVTGYTSVGSAAEVGPGTYYLLKGSSGFNYVIIGEKGGGLLNFTKNKIYTSGQFTDIAANSWYKEDDIKRVYELGLMVGNGEKFNPNGNITIAETVTLAAKIHSIYYGKESDIGTASSPWYKSYADYCVSNGITADNISDFTVDASRAFFAGVLTNALPRNALTAINSVTAVPDVPKDQWYAENVLALYNAGVVAGTDKYGTFKPLSNISRIEVSIIIAKMVDTSLRSKFTLEKQSVAASPAPAPAAPAPAAPAAALTPAQTLEKNLLDQGLAVVYTSYVIQDTKYKSLYPDMLSAVFLNSTPYDIKNAVIAFAAWDSNKLPVKIKGQFDFSDGAYVKEVNYSDINLVPNDVYGDNSGYELDRYNTISSFKAVVVSYETFDGIRWQNPYYNEWVRTYSGVKFTEQLAPKKTEYYAEYPTVPDFGKLTGSGLIGRDLSKFDSEGFIIYNYDMWSLYNLPKFLWSYVASLQQAGFVYVSNSNSDSNAIQYIKGSKGVLISSYAQHYVLIGVYDDAMGTAA